MDSHRSKCIHLWRENSRTPKLVCTDPPLKSPSAAQTRSPFTTPRNFFSNVMFTTLWFSRRPRLPPFYSPSNHIFLCCQFPFHSSPRLLSFSIFPLQKNEGDLFHRLWHVMNEILDLRRQVLVGHLTHDRMRDVKQHITARLDWGNE